MAASPPYGDWEFTVEGRKVSVEEHTRSEVERLRQVEAREAERRRQSGSTGVPVKRRGKKNEAPEVYGPPNPYKPHRKG